MKVTALFIEWQLCAVLAAVTSVKFVVAGLLL
jgi:hypothetical protein